MWPDATTPAPAGAPPAGGQGAASAVDDQIAFTVTDVDCSKTELAGGTVKAMGTFCVATLGLTNVGNHAAPFHALDQKARDSTQLTLSVDYVAQAAVGEASRSIQAGTSATVQVVFQARAGATLLELELHEEPVSRGVVVKLA